MLNRRFAILLVIAGLFPTAGAVGQERQRFILRARAEAVGSVLSRHALTQSEVLRDGDETTVLVDDPVDRTPDELEGEMGLDLEVAGFERDRRIEVPERLAGARLTQSTAAILEALRSRTPVGYYGTTVPAAYAAQPAWWILNLPTAQATATGNAVVAVIDTGVDPSHPLLRGVVVPGYDFTRNVAGVASDMIDLPQSTAAILEQSTAAILEQRHVFMVNQSTAAILEQSTAAILEGLPPAFGHGTMVAGLIHYVAPTARIMPLKAFHADGSSKLSDILRAIYYAVDNGARVINMSFSTPTASGELAHAVAYAEERHVIAVAAAGNDGEILRMFPSGNSKVIGVGATTNTDLRSAFSNYGDESHVRVAAPGETLVTSYPGGHYAAVSGTSFSTGLASGTVALLLHVSPRLSLSDVRNALSEGAVPVSGFEDGRINPPGAIREGIERSDEEPTATKWRDRR